MGVPPNGWFIRENPIKMDDWRVHLFQETSISNNNPETIEGNLPISTSILLGFHFSIFLGIVFDTPGVVNVRLEASTWPMLGNCETRNHQ